MNQELKRVYLLALGMRYRVFSPSESRVILSRNVIFDENFMLNSNEKSIVTSIGVGESSSVDEQVEMQLTSVVNELQHQDGEDQHFTTETVVLPETEMTEISENVVPENSS